MAEKVRTTRAKVDKEIRLTELKKFAENFKLVTPVPKDLIGILTKDPAKQKQIREKVKANAEELAKEKEAAAKDKEGADQEAEKEKKVRALKKKIRQAKGLKERMDMGESLLPEQISKVIKINELIRQLDTLGFDADGEPKA